VLVAASGLVAAASVVVTLAASGTGSDSPTSQSAAPSTATPDRATLYQRGAELRRPAPLIDRNRAAERFHHFR
jgi:hypothetical protein